jgi:hypothetical protein
VKTKYELPASVQNWLHLQVQNWGFDLGQPHKIAPLIMEQSRAYQNDASVTPWQSASQHVAYLAYFFPLNYVRILKVLDESRHWNFWPTQAKIVDYGCGPGTVTQAILEHTQLNPAEIFAFDQSASLKPYFDHLPGHIHFSTSISNQMSPQHVLVASYALNELNSQQARHFFDYDNIILIEPSTKASFSRLLEFRDQLLAQGYHIGAPCPHADHCPLAPSPKDWCHDRVYWEPPSWWADLEKNLPIKNPSMTFSYLMASRRPRPEHPDYLRVIGDGLKEKGKTRWLVCEASEKKFISFLKRSGQAPSIYRGERVSLVDVEPKGNELRFQSIIRR